MIYESFKEQEANLLTKIKNSDSPFLGLFEDHFDQKIRKNITSLLQDSYDPFRRYLDFLKEYPALFSTLLVVQLLEDFGESGYFEVYPVLEKIFGHVLTQGQKGTLWRSFRSACLFDLGISISPRTSGTHFMVEEYLRQVGLPLRFVKRYTEKAVRYTEQAGIPDINDPELLKLWQEGLVERLNAPVPKSVKRSIQRDDTCYYSQLFIHCLSDHYQSDNCSSRIESQLFESIQEGPQIRTAKRAAIPQVVFREFEYGILLPGSDDTNQWQISGENLNHTCASHTDERFVPFETTLLPSEISISNDAGFKWHYPLWEDKKNNRLILFSLPEGKFSGCTSLAEKEFFLEPGNYLLLMRFIPDLAEDLEIFCEDPSLYLKKIFLAPGEIHSIQRGPAELMLKADEKPVLHFNKDPLRGVRGNELYPSDGLKLEIMIPKEMMENQTKFSIKIKSNSLGETIDLTFPAQQENTFYLNIGKVMDKYWKPGISRVLFEIFRQDIKRSLARKAAVVWNGLFHVEKRIIFQCHKLPKNLVEDNCENLQIDLSKQVITFRDETNRFFKMVFEDGPRNLFFTWAVPGIFLSLIDHSRPDESERAIHLGETISINPSTRKAITIFASEPGILIMGDFSIEVDFSRIGSRKIHLASLIEYLEPGQNTLYFKSERLFEPVPIIQLVSPFEAREYCVGSDIGIRKIELVIFSPIQAIRISSKNLIDGQSYETTVTFDDIGQTLRDELVPDIYITFFLVDQNSCIIHFPETNLQSGFWIFSFMLKANNRWGSLTNDKGKIYADGIISGGNIITPNPDEIFGWFEDNHDPETFPDIFCRLHRALKVSYTKQSWNNLSWLELFWTKLSKILAAQNSIDDNLKILQLITDHSTITQDEHTIPSLHPGTSLSQIFCLDKSFYPNKKLSNSSFHICFRFISRLSNLCQIFSDGYFDFAALFAFSNAGEVVARQSNPKQFKMSAYIESLKARDIHERWRLLNDDQWIPAKGDMLGPMHYRYALTRFRGEFSNSLAADSNRLGESLFLTKKTSSFSIINFIDKAKFSPFTGKIDIGIFDECIDSQMEYLDEKRAISIEHQRQIIRFISLFAQVCRCEARNPGVIEKFKTKICKTCNYSPNSMNKPIGYLLYLAEDLFGFYLLLWELVFSADCDQPRRIYV